MSSTSLLVLFKVFFSLALGILLARRSRGFLRKGITGTIPMKDRMADNFLQRLAKLSTYAGIGVALLVASTSYWGLSEALGAGKMALSSASTPVIEPDVLDFPPDERPLDALPEPIVQPTPAPSPEPSPSPAPLTFKPSPGASRRIARAEMEPFDGNWYLQIYAFDNAENAYRYYERYHSRYGSALHLKSAPGDFCPWKIVIGPFRSNLAVRQYAQQHGLRGFPRHEDGLRE
jgi:hypothetical protein